MCLLKNVSIQTLQKETSKSENALETYISARKITFWTIIWLGYVEGCVKQSHKLSAETTCFIHIVLSLKGQIKLCWKPSGYFKWLVTPNGLLEMILERVSNTGSVVFFPTLIFRVKKAMTKTQMLLFEWCCHTDLFLFFAVFLQDRYSSSVKMQRCEAVFLCVMPHYYKQPII